MKTIRRRAASPALSWTSAGPNRQYRVAVRNEDTGEARTIYDGFRTECRLPADLRLSPDQLSFRVESRPADEPNARFVRWQDFTAIPRIGDDHETTAPDLLAGQAQPGVSQYRLVVLDLEQRARLVDFVRPEPRFLLPAGRLLGRDAVYDVMHRHGPGWRRQKRARITPDMLEAAGARAERLVDLPAPARPKVKGEPGRFPPGRLDTVSRRAGPAGKALLFVVDATAAPQAAAAPDPEAVIREQWWAGDGSAAVEQVALALEKNDRRGLFMLDIFADEALGDGAAADLGRTLIRSGHDVGLMLNAEPWVKVSASLNAWDQGQRIQEGLRRFEAAFGSAPRAVSFGPDQLDESALETCAALGVHTVLADRASQLRLPTWMRWRTMPFAVHGGLVVIPEGMILSTPAHGQDRTVRHALASTDALSAASAALIGQALQATTQDDALIVARIQPLSLRLRRQVRSRDQADAWNAALARRPAWAAAGWTRSPHGFERLEGEDEIRSQMALGLLEGLSGLDLPPADPARMLRPAALRTLCAPLRPIETLVEQRRGIRVMRRSAVRRYDEAYRTALRTPAE